MHRTLRSLLILGRVSNLPTVWSNCLAGWMLAGGSLTPSPPLLLLCAGCSLLYAAGMYLNDACDVAFDTAYRPERPIPAGTISRRSVLFLGCSLLAAGCLTLLWAAPGAAGLIAGLSGVIVLYDLLHKKISSAPFLMAGCRMLIYPVAAATAARHLGRPLEVSSVARLWWAATAMGVWILTLTLLARTEAKPGSFRRAVLLLLAVPSFIGAAANGAFGVIPAMLLIPWIVWCVLRLQHNGRVGAAVGNLIAAIPLVDLTIVFPNTLEGYLFYLACTGLALLLRRSIPPT